MPFRSNLIDPEDLNVLVAAFDSAWLSINTLAPVALLHQPDARDFLGHVIFGLWQGGDRDALADRAVRLYDANGMWA